MTIQQAASAAVKYFPDPYEAATIVAIAGAESGWKPDARGDKAEGDLARYRAWACNDYLSWGLGQVFLGVWISKVSEFSGIPISRPCDAAAWLCDPDNNMRMCRHISTVQGWTAWSAFNSGNHLQYMDAARAAIETALQEPPAAPATVTAIEVNGDEVRITLSDGGSIAAPMPPEADFALKIDLHAVAVQPRLT